MQDLQWEFERTSTMLSSAGAPGVVPRGAGPTGGGGLLGTITLENAESRKATQTELAQFLSGPLWQTAEAYPPGQNRRVWEPAGSAPAAGPVSASGTAAATAEPHGDKRVHEFNAEEAAAKFSSWVLRQAGHGQVRSESAIREFLAPRRP